MSNPQFNPLASGNQSSPQGSYKHTVQNTQGALPFLGPGSSVGSSIASSGYQDNSRPMIPMIPSPANYIDMHFRGVREEMRPLGGPMHQPVDQDSFSTQRHEVLSPGTGMEFYPKSTTSAPLGHKHNMDGRNDDWSSNYRNSTVGNLPPAQSSYTSREDGRFSTTNEMQQDMKSVPGYATVSTESYQPKYTAESAAKILQQFGLESEDFEQLISYPEDQMTPANIPFILQEIRLEKDKRATTVVPPKTVLEPQPSRTLSSEESFNLTRAGGALMPLENASSSPLQSRMIDCDGSGKYKAGSRDAGGRVQDSSSSTGSMPAFPQSSDTTKKLPLQANQALQYILKSLPLLKKDSGVGGLKSNTLKTFPAKETKSKHQPSATKTQPPNKGFHDVQPNYSGLPSGRNEASGTKDERKKKDKGPIGTEHIVRQKDKEIEEAQQTQKKQIEKKQAQEDQNRETKHVSQMGQTMGPPLFPAVQSVPPYPFLSAVFANLIPNVTPSVVPHPSTGLVTYNHLAAVTSSTQPSPKEEVSKDQPTQAMINDYAATPPEVFPHTCSLCNRKCINMQEWISHQINSLHKENCKQLCRTYPKWAHELKSSRHKTRSPSKSPERHRHHGSDGRRNKRHSRSRSPHRSTHQRRSRSPRYHSRISVRHRSHSRSPERRSRKSDRRRSASRSRDDRRLTPRSHEGGSPPRRKRERRSSTGKSSSGREKKSSAETLEQKLLETSASLTGQVDKSSLEAMVKDLAPALVAELAKMKSSSSSGDGHKRSSSPVAAVKTSPSTSSSTAVKDSAANVPRVKPSQQMMTESGKMESSSSSSDGHKHSSSPVAGVKTSPSTSSSAAKMESCCSSSSGYRHPPPSADVKTLPSVSSASSSAPEDKPIRLISMHGKAPPSNMVKLHWTNHLGNFVKPKRLRRAAEKYGKTSTIVMIPAVSQAFVNFKKPTDAEKLRHKKVLVIDGINFMIGETQEALSKDPLPTSGQAGPDSGNALADSSVVFTPPTVGEMLDRLLDLTKFGLISNIRNKKKKFGRFGVRPLLLTKLPKFVPGVYTEEDIAKLLAPFGFQHADDNIFVFPLACMAFVVMPTPQSTCEVMKAASKQSFRLKTVPIWVSLVPMEWTTPLRLYHKLMHQMRTCTNVNGDSIVFIKNIPWEKVWLLREDLKHFGPFKNFMPLLNKVFIEFESAEVADRFEHWYSSQTHHSKPYRLDKYTCSNPGGGDAPQPTDAGKMQHKFSSPCSADDTPVTHGEMVISYLHKQTVECLPENFCFSPKFLKSGRKLMRITELPASDCYSEADIANLLGPFGFQYRDDTIYVIPQTRMAFIVMETPKKVQNLMKTCKKHPLILKGATLCFDVVTRPIETTLLGFYKSLMNLVGHPVSDDGKRTIFIRNISQSDIKDLRQALTKIGSVWNFLPLLNKVFVEFDSVRDADRLGVWYSFLKEHPGHVVYRLKIPKSGLQSLPPRLPVDALPTSKAVIEGAMAPSADSVIPQGSFAPFWISSRNSPYVFPTVSPWFIIPEFQTISDMSDIEKAKDSDSTTIMLTNLPEGSYKHEDVARLVWPYFTNQSLKSLYYNVAVLPLQKRAFVFFPDKKSCSDFLQAHTAEPTVLKGFAVKAHVVLQSMNPDYSEEMLYKSLQKWSNVATPDPNSLEERLLCVRISEVSVAVVRVVLEVLASVAPFANFLPLANRVIVEMAEPSGVMKVMEKRKSLRPNKQSLPWEKVTGLETVTNLKKRLFQAEIPTVKCQNQNPSSEPLDDGPTILDPITAELNSDKSVEAKTGEAEKQETEVPVDSTVDSPSVEDGKEMTEEEKKPTVLDSPSVEDSKETTEEEKKPTVLDSPSVEDSKETTEEEKKPTVLISATDTTSASGIGSENQTSTMSRLPAPMPEEDIASLSQIDSEILEALSATVHSLIDNKVDFEDSNIPSLDEKHEDDIVSDDEVHHDVKETSQEPLHCSNPTSTSKSGPPLVTEPPSSPRTCSTSAAQEKEEIKSKVTVEDSVERHSDDRDGTAAQSNLEVSAESYAGRTVELEMETFVQLECWREESKYDVNTDKEMDGVNKDCSFKAPPVEPISERDSHMVQDNIFLVKQLSDETENQEVATIDDEENGEGVKGKMLARESCKVSEDPRIPNVEPPLQRSGNKDFLKDPDGDNKDLQIKGSTDEQTADSRPLTEEEDIYQTDEYTKVPPTITETESDQTVRETVSREDKRRSRSGRKSKASKVHEKSPKKQDETVELCETQTEMDITEDNEASEIESTKDNPPQDGTSQEHSGRRRSTRGKVKDEAGTTLGDTPEKPDEDVEATSQVPDPAEREHASGRPSITTRASRGRRKRTTVDVSTDKTNKVTLPRAELGESTPSTEDRGIHNEEDKSNNTAEEEELRTQQAASKEKQFLKDEEASQTNEGRSRSSRGQGDRERKNEEGAVDAQELATPDDVGAQDNQDPGGNIKEEDPPEEEGREEKAQQISTCPFGQDSESADILNRQAEAMLEEAGSDENQAGKTSGTAKRKQSDATEESMNSDETGKVTAPRRRGRAKRARLTPVRKSSRGKNLPEKKEPTDEHPPHDEESFKLSNVSKVELQQTAVSRADIEDASAGLEQQLETKTQEGSLEKDEEEEEERKGKSRQEIKVLSKTRRDFQETGAKRSCSESPAYFSLPELKPDTPLGQEFVIPKSGFFCTLCSVFYLKEKTAKEIHCNSQEHYDKLKEYYQKASTSSSPNHHGSSSE